MMNKSATKYAVLVGLIAMIGGACAAETTTEESTVLTAALEANVHDLHGEDISVVVLPGSRLSDVESLVRVELAEAVVEVVQYDDVDGNQVIEVSDESGLALGALELRGSATVLRSPDGRALIGDGAPVPLEDALERVDERALIVMQPDVLSSLAAAIQGWANPLPDGAGESRQALASGFPVFASESGCGTTCESRNGDASCCCGVNKRCVSYYGTCECEDATTSLQQ